MEERYEPAVIEPRWQARWEQEQLFAAREDGRERRYVLEMFPYPSGALHMGHVRNYLIGDVIARYLRMQGHDVLHPMGWDALGLPAENAAIRDRLHPARRTADNVVSFKAEMQRIGFSYDWSREIDTSRPEYYRWNQWFFLRMRERGLVYRRRAAVNWCTGCLTVIANEQVIDGECERCNSAVVVQRRPEWAFRITRYSQRLLDNLDRLERWPAAVIKKQRDWIGRSDGANLDFRVKGTDLTLRVFTTRPDTIYGCTYCVVAPDHPLLQRFVAEDRRQEVEAFSAEQARKAAKRARDDGPPKEGVDTGARAIHPFTGAELPIWAANFVVADYGTGCVMSVPAHDTRDFEFARAHGLPVVTVIQPEDGERLPMGDALTEAFTEPGVLEGSGDFTGMGSAEAKRAIAAAAERAGLGGPAATYRQRDWGISRQRYWGTPIPIVYCDACDPEHEGIGVPEDQLPVAIPEIDVEQVLTGRGEPPLAKVPEFVEARCPRCAGPARREVETMDTFVDSAWYFARYLDPHNQGAPFDPGKARDWLPVDVYVGGPEHSTMHLLYFRFWAMVMQELGLCTAEDPVEQLICQGIVNGPDGRKMGKRWGNVVPPARMVERYGADATRTFVMFAGPPDRDIQWSDEQADGCSRFLLRVWRLAWTHRAAADARHEGDFAGEALRVRRAAHRTLAQVTTDIERHSFNTAIARCMELVNLLTPIEPSDDPALATAMTEAVRLLCFMLAPFAPHLADEIGGQYGFAGSLQAERWPQHDPALVVAERATYGVQVNGRVRAQVELAADADEAAVRAAAEADDNVQAHLDGKSIHKVIFVRRRLINFVAR